MGVSNPSELNSSPCTQTLDFASEDEKTERVEKQHIWKVCTLFERTATYALPKSTHNQKISPRIQ